MDLMSNMDKYQTKESSDRIMWGHQKTVGPEKQDSSREESLSSLPED